jgi:hypothetical protein
MKLSSIHGGEMPISVIPLLYARVTFHRGHGKKLDRSLEQSFRMGQTLGDYLRTHPPRHMHFNPAVAMQRQRKEILGINIKT